MSQLNSVEARAEAYVSPLKAMYAHNSSAVRALPMKKYMLNQFEFFGIKSDSQNELRGAFLRNYGLPGADILAEVVRHLYALPEREFQYAAIHIAETTLRKTVNADIGLIEFMITQKSWWDTVDWVASHLAGHWFSKHPDQIAHITGQWMASDNIWLQRSAILFQLKYKNNTDESLLFGYCSRLKHSGEFFIRKAIGWALREYSKTNPQQVMSFVDTHPDLSGLSRREALKRIAKSQNALFNG